MANPVAHEVTVPAWAFDCHMCKRKRIAYRTFIRHLNWIHGLPEAEARELVELTIDRALGIADVKSEEEE